MGVPQQPDTDSRDLAYQEMVAGGGSTVSLNKLDRQASSYGKLVELMAQEPSYQRDVTLGKRIGFYKMGKELGSGNFSKVKLGLHLLTKREKNLKQLYD